MVKQFNTLDIEAIEYGRLRAILKTFTKDSKILQAHDYMILEDKDFKGEILDVGCGPGVFAIITKLKNPKTNISVMDGSILNLEIMRTLMDNSGIKKTKIPMLHGFIGQEFDKKYDTLVLNHIIEHLENLDMVFTWLDTIIKPGGTIFIAVPYKECHFSPNHIHFFKVTNDNFKSINNPDLQYFDIEKYLNKRGYNSEITIFDESVVDKRQPYDSRGQLDMLIKIKVEK